MSTVGQLFKYGASELLGLRSAATDAAQLTIDADRAATEDGGENGQHFKYGASELLGLRSAATNAAQLVIDEDRTMTEGGQQFTYEASELLGLRSSATDSARLAIDEDRTTAEDAGEVKSNPTPNNFSHAIVSGMNPNLMVRLNVGGVLFETKLATLKVLRDHPSCLRSKVQN